MNDETALLAAITAQPGEDTPRLAYADWLDEHDAPIQAEFVRLQCQLASASAADPDYPDFVERYAEVAVRFAPFAKHTAPVLPPGFAVGPDLGLDRDAGHFRRGFLDTVRGVGNWPDGSDFSRLTVDHICDNLAKLVATTTARHLNLEGFDSGDVARVLAAPGAAALTGLAVQNYAELPAGFMRALAAAPDLGRLEHLALNSGATVAGLHALAGKLPRLHSLEFHNLSGPANRVPTLGRTSWFKGLRRVSVGAVDTLLQEPLLAALAAVPHLDALELQTDYMPGQTGFAGADAFPALARLQYQGVAFAAPQLARAKFPRLAEFAAFDLTDNQLQMLLRAKWFPQVRVLNVSSSGRLTDAAAVALSKSAAAPHLRHLRATYNSLGRKGLAALTNGGRFPSLTALDLAAAWRPGTRPATLVRVASELSLPRLRHLNLCGWPLGDDGAKALAANRSLSNLTRLSLSNCDLGEKGLAALVRSRHLQGLIELDVTNNKLTTAAALLDTDRLPRLAAARLAGNLIPHDAHRVLHHARGLVV